MRFYKRFLNYTSNLKKSKQLLLKFILAVEENRRWHDGILQLLFFASWINKYYIYNRKNVWTCIGMFLMCTKQSIHFYTFLNSSPNWSIVNSEGTLWSLFERHWDTTINGTCKCSKSSSVEFFSSLKTLISSRTHSRVNLCFSLHDCTSNIL